MELIRGMVLVTTLDECGRESGGVRVVAGLVDNTNTSPEALSALTELLGRWLARFPLSPLFVTTSRATHRVQLHTRKVKRWIRRRRNDLHRRFVADRASLALRRRCCRYPG